ncbi:MAG: histidinol dehydrogenase [Anaerolineaceae bacterium]|nr:histidinol dehydrogenase [Anaerolineaceae bacterium]
MQLKRFTAKQARETILKRVPIDAVQVPGSVLSRLKTMFGQPTTPSQAVDFILEDIRQKGDPALIRWAERIDGPLPPEGLRVPQQTLQDAHDQLDLDLKQSLQISIDRVRAFHQAQPITSWITSQSGGTLGQFVRPIQRVGLYIPAGTAPLPSSIIMTAVIAQVAGVSEIALATPIPSKTGKISPVILATAAMLGITEVYCVGGAQAIAGLAYGTKSIPKVDKIFGPGNLFVTLAKKKVYGSVGIDSIAGPTETVVIADETANPAWVAADLLAQAEHDVLASAILLTPSLAVIKAVQKEVERQIKQRSRKSEIQASMANRSGAVLTKDLDEALALANEYAPEHMCISTESPWQLAEKVTCAGGVFLGEYSCEVLGDYVAGPSHVMPTSGSARYASPVNITDFIHFISIIALDQKTAQEIAPIANKIALSEDLDAHAYAAEVRI